MTKQTGIWIDHKRAVILMLNDDSETLQVVESGVERHPRFRGSSRPRTPYSAQYQQGDNQLDRQFEGHLNKYYTKVIAQLGNIDLLYIFGPGEAKYEFKRHLEQNGRKITIEDIENADKMTDRQIIAKVRDHFSIKV
jgi:hypothetical protein